MREDGYKAIMVKVAVGDSFRAAAKAEGKTLTAFLEALLHRYNKGEGLYDTCNNEIKGIVEEVREVREELKRVRDILEELRR